MEHEKYFCGDLGNKKCVNPEQEKNKECFCNGLLMRIEKPKEEIKQNTNQLKLF